MSDSVECVANMPSQVNFRSFVIVNPASGARIGLLCCGFRRDRLFFLTIRPPESLIRRLKIRSGRLGDGASMRTYKQAFAFEIGKVAPDRGCSDPEKIL